MAITWASTLEIEHDAKSPSQYHSTRRSRVTLHLGTPAGGSVQNTAYGVHMSSRPATGSSSAPAHQQQILGIHLSSLWRHLSSTTTGTDATTFTTTRCALPLDEQQPAVSRQNESQQSSRLTVSLLMRARPGNSNAEKKEPFDQVRHGPSNHDTAPWKK
ncbi:hypothetical protein B0T20DRAFT_449714 [Sordaria brevicollis]|uniref:Uncharacterized protein n=1 Tax=Sordaria brevicollis TaxID=83679 RepID=A0AAE0UG21_SORBR|nr:hypothetical protein B0T20DRAFT_449714 [Sordaria brevicollis]